MTVLKLDRITIDPADTGDLLNRIAGPDGMRAPRHHAPRTDGQP